ncbi:NAD(P)-dependent oxidoreductase [Streptomonospora sp. PA3]|uniref:NAD-dependent epimerase/dehydratase family protein n=1 Tax=Streptomonospora sp. PA3 TaxID=2607326 RepID=UPI0012DD37B0|nr:NAD(P)-dependent oxidoreductase [Streptomonospora sp. PA3]MUL44220.1 NAD(P)-dependent oxidoreductase [Streptomonospora sp. PA3]
MDVKLGRVVITGAAGGIGRTVRSGLREESDHLVLVDTEDIEPDGDGETAVKAGVGDRDALREAFGGADAVVHLAGTAEEASLDELIDANVRGTLNVLEAARRAEVPRVVLLSSSRVTGNYPIHHHVFPDEPPRPDGLNGVTRVAEEALGQLYADTFGLQVVALRAGSFGERPTETRHLATWLSPRDCVGFVRAALTAPNVNFVAAYAVSGNARRFWDLSVGESELGYRPADDAARYAGDFPDDDPFWHGGPQGGAAAGAEAILPHLEE